MLNGPLEIALRCEPDCPNLVGIASICYNWVSASRISLFLGLAFLTLNLMQSVRSAGKLLASCKLTIIFCRLRTDFHRTTERAEYRRLTINMPG
jgi:hypothetical protein